MFSPRNKIFLYFVFLLPFYGMAQKVAIKDIQISGNKKTKTKTIVRELTFKVGDTLTYEWLVEEIKHSKNNLINTRLFTDVQINWTEEAGQEGQAKVKVELSENWYIYPAIIFELADRNFNVWWVEQKASLSRVNLGARLDHLNVFGLKDKLKLKVQFGYTHKYELVYSNPYIDREGKWGMSIGGLWSRNREVGYRTVDNALEFYKDEEQIYNRFRLTTSVSYRPFLYSYHEGKLEFYRNSIGDVVIDSFNGDFFRGGRTTLKNFTLSYKYVYSKLDLSIYPEEGTYSSATIRKEGLGLFGDVDLLSVRVNFRKYIKFYEKWSVGSEMAAKTELNRRNPGYYHYTALGYGKDQLRGYEYYVIDGFDFGYAKNHIKFLFLNKKWKHGKWMFIKQFRQMPIKAFAVLSADIGYVNSPYFNSSNELNNQFLLGGGPAIHVLFYNNFLLRTEYSINRKWEHALFLHFNLFF